MNDAVIVNDEFIFRFQKPGYGVKNLKDETNLLRLLRNHTTLAIPSPLYEGDDCLAYRMIPGVTLRRDMLMKLSEDNQQAIADQLAKFLKELHNVPIGEVTGFVFPVADAPMKYERQVDIYRKIREKVFPLLQPHVREWATQHFESFLSDRGNFDFESKLIDADIPPYHVLFDEQKKRISGIIDFGCAGLGDPAIDFGIILYNYGEEFLSRFFKTYPDLKSYLRRARFYAGGQELRWLLTGIERNNTWWFAIHTGGAKDIGYV